MRDRIGWCAAIGLGLMSLFGSSPARGQGAIAFAPTPGVVSDGVNMGVTPAVSADRRYVRLSVGVTSNTVTGFSTFSVPAAVGGGGLGFAGLGGPGGLAGMDGPMGGLGPGGGGFGPGVGGFGPGDGGFGSGAAMGQGFAIRSGGGLGLPGPADPGAFAPAPYGVGAADPATFRPASRSKRLRVKAARSAATRPATNAPAQAVGTAAKPAPGPATPISTGAARTSP